MSRTRQWPPTRRISPERAMLRRLLLLTLGMSTLSLGLAMLSDGVVARAQDAARAQTDPASLPAHDSHQGLLIAVDPYLSVERYKEKFGKQHTPYEAGVLALEVYFRNDNDTPIRINTGTIRLLIGQPGESRQRLEQLSPEDVADRVLLNRGKDPTQRRPQITLPGSIGKGTRNKDWQDFSGKLRSLSMSADLLPPHSTTHGFFYFDIDDHYDWVSNARFEVPDLASMLDNKALFFFEVDLAPSRAK